MVTISDKRFGELLKNSMLLETYKGIADGQYEVIRKQEEASVAGMAEIKRLRKELKAAQETAEMRKRNQDFVVKVNKEISIRSMARAREIDTLRAELAAVRAELEQSKENFRSSVNNTEYWMKSSDTANKNFQAALNEVEHWKTLYRLTFIQKEKVEIELKNAVAALK